MQRIAGNSRRSFSHGTGAQRALDRCANAHQRAPQSDERRLFVAIAIAANLSTR
jgi:hypothetical protein